MGKVLVACEESQEVCKAFRALGHEAYSCDIQECSGGHPEWHMQEDVRDALFKMNWDLVIAHPPCTYLSNAGACRLYPHKGELDKDRYINGLKGKELFMMFWWYGKCGNRIAIENPVPSSIYELPEKSEVIQPYEFGEPWSKKTYLWLHYLPPLFPTDIQSEYKPYVSCGTSANKGNKDKAGMSRSGGAQRVRSKTFPGVAAAMADQWGGLL